MWVGLSGGRGSAKVTGELCWFESVTFFLLKQREERNSSSAIMILRQILRLSSLFHSAVSVHLRRNIGLSAIVFNKTKELDPVQKLFLDKIREYNTKSKQAGGPVDAGPDFQKDMNESLARLQRAYGEGDLTKFPEFKFEEPKFEETPK